MSAIARNVVSGYAAKSARREPNLGAEIGQIYRLRTMNDRYSVSTDSTSVANWLNVGRPSERLKVISIHDFSFTTPLALRRNDRNKTRMVQGIDHAS